MSESSSKEDKVDQAWTQPGRKPVQSEDIDSVEDLLDRARAAQMWATASDPAGAMSQMQSAQRGSGINDSVDATKNKAAQNKIDDTGSSSQPPWTRAAAKKKEVERGQIGKGMTRTQAVSASKKKWN